MSALDAKQLLSEVESLPIDLKTQLIDKLLNSLNPCHADIESLWKGEVEERVADIKGGKVRLVDGNEVFQKIRDRFAK